MSGNITDSPLLTGGAGAALGVAGMVLSNLFQSRAARRVTMQSSIDTRINSLLEGYEKRIASLTGEVTSLTAEVSDLRSQIHNLVVKLEEYEQSAATRDIQSLANRTTGIVNSSRIDQLEQAPSLA